ncbi:hypothetical protein ABPG74_009611 [Tetrahymena malaccensis]
MDKDYRQNTSNIKNNQKMSGIRYSNSNQQQQNRNKFTPQHNIDELMQQLANHQQDNEIYDQASRYEKYSQNNNLYQSFKNQNYVSDQINADQVQKSGYKYSKSSLQNQDVNTMSRPQTKNQSQINQDQRQQLSSQNASQKNDGDKRRRKNRQKSRSQKDETQQQNQDYKNEYSNYRQFQSQKKNDQSYLQNNQQNQLGIYEQYKTLNQFNQLDQKEENYFYRSQNNNQQQQQYVKNSNQNQRPRRQKKSDRMNFHEFQSLLKKDSEQLSEFFFEFQDIKQSLPDIKQFDGYCTLLDLCKLMIFYESQSDNCQMREYLKSILQSDQFKNSLFQILAQIEYMNNQIQMQIHENYASIFIYIINFLNPQQYENEIRIFLNKMLKQFKMGQHFLQAEQKELEEWVKGQEKQKQQIEQQKIIKRFRPQQLFITPLNEIDINIENILVLPDKEELARNTQLTNRYSAIPVQGSYINRYIYMMNNFFLLREDFFREIKQSLHNLIQIGELDHQKIDKNFQGFFYIYCNSIIKDIKFDRAGVFFTINTQPLFIRNKKNYKWDDSRRLMNGSLLILTNDTFDKFYYLIVKRKAQNIDQEFKESNTITVTAELEMDNIQGDEIANILNDLQSFFSQSSVTIFEAKYYWEAYSHFLREIKKMILNQTILPFEKTIINCEKHVGYPDFISNNTTYSMKIDINRPDLGRNLILMRDNWNTVNKGTFDSSQFNCLINILTKQVSIIQGPPGTGKTFVGSMAVKVLVDNYYIWNKQGRPILMICKTNHALDQFLKHILKFEDKIVRVGGRCQEQSLQKYLLRNVKDQYKQSNKKFNTPSLRFLREKIEEVEGLYKKITQEVDDYVLMDEDYDIYLDDFGVDLKFLIMDQFQKFGNFTLNEKNVGYHILQDLILSQWWQCNIDSKKIKEQEILTENQMKQIQNKLNEWNKNMKNQKKQYLEKIMNQKKVDVQQLEQQKLLEEQRLKNPNMQMQDLQSRLNQNQQDQGQNEESDDDDEEENYFENKCEFEVEGNMNMKFLEKQTQESHLLKVKCDFNQLKKLIQQIAKGELNLFKIDYSQAYNLKAYAIQFQQEYTLNQIKQSIKQYHQYMEKFKEEFNQDDARIIVESKCKIIGMTLNGASINSHLIKYLKSPIIIIEEAGEVLESLLIPILQPSTQQLILIGDHQQLKPSVNNYDLEKKYNFNTSLLERLVNNQVEYAQLKVQRRMNPDFADYIRLIYNQYEDHDDLIRYKKNVVGMPSNMYLISHTQNEVKFIYFSNLFKLLFFQDNIENSTSKKNVYEAWYAIKLAQYIIMQKQFKEEEITILSMYLGQCQLIRKLARQEKISKIKISSVDNYQGEENEIVILSLVRSNQSKKLGYTKTENRINVSFSRAKRGFYVIGNFNMINQVQDAKLWQKIILLAKQKQHLVETIYFQCSKHKDVSKVTHYKDFDNMPKGGCQKKCNTSKACGHKCSQTCHPDECEKYKCINSCIRQIEGCGHACQLKCHEKCKCTSNVYKTLLCGHPKLCLCTNDIRYEKCETKVKIQLQCGHQKEVKCYEAKLNNHQCEELVQIRLECGHPKDVKCFQKYFSNHQCLTNIEHKLPCLHSVSIKCCDKNKQYQCKKEVSFQCPNCKVSILKKLCYQNSTNNSCTTLVKKQLKCSHQKEIPCNMKPEDAKCEQEVLKILKCGHQKTLQCYQDPAKENKCSALVQKKLKCNHQYLMECSENPDKIICQVKTSKQLKCGHFIETYCSDSNDQLICQILVNRKLQCGHYAQYILCNELENGKYKCNEILTQYLECGHLFSYQCHQKDVPRKCSQILSLEKMCCHLKYAVSCPDYLNKKYVIPGCFCSKKFIYYPHNQNGNKKDNLCNEICGVTLECGHKCQSTCEQCAFGLLHRPCKQEVVFEYICGHKTTKECGQDPDFCQEKCQIQECVHKSKKCNRKCLEKCSLQITKSFCKQCENQDITELSCGHKFQNLDEIFSLQFQQNPLCLPQCQICNQPINSLKYKIILKDIKVNCQRNKRNNEKNYLRFQHFR